LKRDKIADAADPRRVVFWKEVTLPKTPVDRWTELGFFLVRNDSAILRQRATTALLQHARTPEERAAAEQVLAGYRLERMGDGAGALARYAQARKEHPACAQAHLFYGNLATRLSRLPEAAEAYGKLVALDGHDYEVARSRYAGALLDTGHVKEAMDQLADAETALGKARIPGPVSLVRARCYAAQGNFAETDRWLAKAGAGGAQLPEDALREINTKRAEAAVKASPGSADVRLTYARVLADTGRREEALGQIRKAVALEPSQPWAFIDLGTTLWELDRREEAVANLEHAVKLGQDNAEALLALAGAYRDLGRYRDALPLYKKVTEAQKLNLRARHYYALMLYAAGQTRDARREWVEVIHQARDKGELRESGVPEAGLYFGPKRRLVAGFSVPEAQADLQILEALQDLEVHPDTGLLWQNIGSALTDLGLPDLGLAALEKARKLDGSLPETRFLIALAYRKLGQPERALKEFEAVVAGNPLHPRARLELAQLYTDRGEIERAQAQLAAHNRTYPRTRDTRASLSLGG
jgi:tetratricopeptide (TPR) repeat protein